MALRRKGVPDKRGSSTDRRKRREWLWEQRKETVIELHDCCSGNPEEREYSFIRCHHCKTSMSFDQFEVDRFPICGHDGGRYVRNNVVPSCSSCNKNRCPKCRKERSNE